MVRCRFTGANHYVGEESLDEGDVIDLSDEQYERWSHKFVRLDEDVDETDAQSDTAESEEDGTSPEDESETDDNGAQDDTEETDLDVDVADLTVAELQDRLSDGDFDDRLDEIEVAERSGKNRDTAISAIVSRQNTIEDNSWTQGE